VSSFLDELFAYVEFGDADRERLRMLHGVLEPHFPEVADRFYEAVWANPGSAAILTGRDQVERLRVTLVDWMSTGLRGPYDERFYEKRSRIGRRHVAIGLASHYMFTAMNIVRSSYHELIVKHFEFGRAHEMVQSVNKLLDIELAIMLRHYQLDSDEKLVARERRSQSEKLAAMQTMSAGLAHEVRNPLNAAKLQLELLERRLRRSGVDEKLLEPTDLAQKEIERLTALLNDFLAFARPPELHAQEHDVATIVRQVVELERVTARGHQANLDYVVAPEQLIANVDAARFHQIVLNLVRNAIEAVPPNGHVAVELSIDNDQVHLRVVDDGPGIPEAVRARIYEPFFSTKEGGTGLGMSIVHSLIALHGGTIELDTSPRGTRFDVYVPRR
jgi:signal transduction histidine kinase